MAALAERYMRVHVAVNCKASSAQSYRGVIDKHILPALGERKLGDVKRADVAALHYALRDTPGVANTTLQVLSQLFYKAEQWRLIGPGRSPCRSIPKYRLRARERYLSGGEYRRLGQVLKAGQADGSLGRGGGGGVAPAAAHRVPAGGDSHAALGRRGLRRAGASAARQQGRTAHGRADLGGEEGPARDSPIAGQPLGDRG